MSGKYSAAWWALVQNAPGTKSFEPRRSPGDTGVAHTAETRWTSTSANRDPKVSEPSANDQ